MLKSIGAEFGFGVWVEVFARKQGRSRRNISRSKPHEGSNNLVGPAAHVHPDPAFHVAVSKPAMPSPVTIRLKHEAGGVVHRTAAGKNVVRLASAAQARRVTKTVTPMVAIKPTPENTHSTVVRSRSPEARTSEPT